MQIKSIVAGAAITLAATIGSVSAADQFTTLDGVTANPMSSGELAAVKGQFVHWTLSPAGIGGILDPPSADGGPNNHPLRDAGCAGCEDGVFRIGDPFDSSPILAPGAEGLLKAEGTGKAPINVCTGAAGAC